MLVLLFCLVVRISLRPISTFQAFLQLSQQLLLEQYSTLSVPHYSRLQTEFSFFFVQWLKYLVKFVQEGPSLKDFAGLNEEHFSALPHYQFIPRCSFSVSYVLTDEEGLYSDDKVLKTGTHQPALMKDCSPFSTILPIKAHGCSFHYDLFREVIEWFAVQNVFFFFFLKSECV